jgi:cytoplasmic iron level regulating protein YaaA (DUF328/UPF0246 family)
MARHLAEVAATNEDDVKSFSKEGYSFHPTLSEKDKFVFTRG